MKDSKSKKIAICGAAGHLNLIHDFGCHQGDTWVLGAHYGNMPMRPDGKRADRIYEIHGQENKFAKMFSDPFHRNKLKGEEIWLAHDTDWANVLPYEGIMTMFPTQKVSLCGGSSISWMLAHALFENEFGIEAYSEIHLLGVDMAAGSEWGYQRDSLFYLIGRAEAAFIDIVIPDDSKLICDHKLYWWV